MALQYPQQDYISMGSKTTSVPTDLISTASVYESDYVGQARIFPSIQITRSFLINAPNVGVARVLNPFYIRVQPVEEGFAAVSDISDVYELGETARQAVANYLFSLVDEIIWFQKHKESLSRPMLRDFAKLQFYIGLM